MLGDWIDTAFGPDYIVEVYKGDPNSGGVKLSAAGSGTNDTWFFDYSSGVLKLQWGCSSFWSYCKQCIPCWIPLRWSKGYWR